MMLPFLWFRLKQENDIGSFEFDLQLEWTFTKLEECMQSMYFSYPFRVLGLLELLVGGAVAGMLGNDDEETKACC